MQVSIHEWFSSYDDALAALFKEGMPHFPIIPPSDWYYYRKGNTTFVGKIEKGTGASRDLWLMGFAIMEVTTV